MILKQLAVDHEAGIALKPIKGSLGDHLYAQNVALVAAKAGAQFTTSTEVAAQSATNQLVFAGEVATLILDLIPVTKGVSAVNRLSKAALKALRVPGRSLPKLLTQPGRWGAVYSDFAMAASGFPLLRKTPLRPVFRAPTALQRDVKLPENLLSPSSSSNAGSWQSTSSSQKTLPVLANTKARDLNAEKHLAGGALNTRAPRAELVSITKPEDLNVVSKPNTVSKFVFTQDKQLIVGNIDKGVPPKWLSHPAIAEIGAGTGQSEQVISAGYIRKDRMGKTHLSNVSGHYLPKQSDLKPAQEYLKNMGVGSTKSKLPIP
jgi:hypothetical protein